MANGRLGDWGVTFVTKQFRKMKPRQQRSTYGITKTKAVDQCKEYPILCKDYMLQISR